MAKGSPTPHPLSSALRPEDISEGEVTKEIQMSLSDGMPLPWRRIASLMRSAEHLPKRLRALLEYPVGPGACALDTLSRELRKPRRD
jgi:hypothetical protein